MTKKKESGGICVRVLDILPHEGKVYQPNQLLILSEGDADQFKKSGSVDDSEAAVAYCKNQLKVDPVVHVALADDVAESGEATAETAVEAE